jgi:hypothetical protein
MHKEITETSEKKKKLLVLSVNLCVTSMLSV